VYIRNHKVKADVESFTLTLLGEICLLGGHHSSGHIFKQRRSERARDYYCIGRAVTMAFRTSKLLSIEFVRVIFQVLQTYTFVCK